MFSSFEPDAGLYAYRELSNWYIAMPQSSTHELRCKVMRPSQATKADFLKVPPDKQSSLNGIVFRCSPV